ncbi:MAG: DUF502 domain-containing protein [Prosthecobacter sp.]|nr:DUF502 domain-containing protein [Prosthecobacter sp.]
MPPPTVHPPAPPVRSPLVWLRNKFFTGLAVALPLLITFWVLSYGYHLLHGWSEPTIEFIALKINDMEGRQVVDPSGETFRQVVNLTGFLMPVVAFVLLGIMATHVIGVRIVGAIDKLFLRVPVASFIYRMMKQVIDGFKGMGGRQNFKRVVYVDYPAAEMKMLGFVTGQYLDPQQGKVLAAVFVPGALSPMTGLLLVVPVEQLTDAPLTVEEAMKLIFSGGLVVPSSLAAPAAKPDILPVPADAAVAPEVQEAMDVPEEPALPAGLPRAEDFDFGDPDILSGSEREGTQLIANRASAGRRILGALTRRKTS